MPVDDIPPRSYGPLLETTLRIVTWNVWGRYGPWPQREAAIMATLQGVRPDIVVLTESWAKGDDSQCARLAGPLGLPHCAFSGVTPQEDEDVLSGVAVMSRWPDRRIDYVFSANPRSGGAGHPVRAIRCGPRCWAASPSTARTRRITTPCWLISATDRGIPGARSSRHVRRRRGRAVRVA